MYPMRVLTLLVLSAAAAAVGCGDASPHHDAPKAPEVYVTTPIKRNVTDSEIFTGRVESPRSVDIRAHVTGYLDWADFQEGREVNEGDLLARIDPRTYKATYEQTEAALGQAIAHRDRLYQDYQRDSGLARRGDTAISKADYDKTVGDYKEAEAAVKSAIANRDFARVNLNYCTITAPFSGRISRRAVDPGNLIRADDTIITSLVRTDRMYVYFDVDERTRNALVRKRASGLLGTGSQSDLSVHMGLADEVDKDGKPLFPHEGVIDFEDNRLDALTGTLRMRAVFNNPRMGSEKGPRLLSPGLFARVRLPVSEPGERILVPEQALSTDQGEKFLYVVRKMDVLYLKDGKEVVGTLRGETDAGYDMQLAGGDQRQVIPREQAQRVATGDDREDRVLYRKVQIGALHDGWRVIEEGLAMGERVIVSGLQRARPKLKVTAKPATKDQMPAPNGHTSPTKVPFAIKLPPAEGGPGGPRPVPQPSAAGGR